MWLPLSENKTACPERGGIVEAIGGKRLASTKANTLRKPSKQNLQPARTKYDEVRERLLAVELPASCLLRPHLQKADSGVVKSPTPRF
ncbi:MAG: hypothetical protein WKF84_26770 [Pyrinomonadaceae bacterium]